MGEEEMTTGKAYAYSLLETWGRIRTLGAEVRTNYLLKRIDRRKNSEYVSLLCDLGIELSEKVQGRTEFGDLPERFRGFEHDFIQPTRLYLKIPRALELHSLLRETLEKLRLTSFDGEN